MSSPYGTFSHPEMDRNLLPIFMKGGTVFMNLTHSSIAPKKANEILAVAEPYLSDLAEEYLAQQKATLSEVEQLVKARNTSAIQNIGHKLRGNAALFGLPWIAEKGRMLETMAAGGALEESVHLSQEMLHYLNQVRFVKPHETQSSPPLESVL